MPAKKKTAKKAVAKKAAAKKTSAKSVSKIVTSKPAKKVAKKAVEAKEKSAPAPKPKTKKAAKAPVVKPAAKKARKMKMTPFIRKQRQRLLDLRDTMVDTTQGIARDTLQSGTGGADSSGSGMHTGDAGSDAYDKDLALNILSKETDALHEIEEALLRIENKTYGICEMCEDDIPEVRLEALPFCRLTIECQTELEAKNGYGKKNSSAVGYGR